MTTDDERFQRLREEYAGTPLREHEVSADPIEQFGRWFDDAVAANIRLANGFVLATVGPEGQPSARVLLLKGFDHRGFVFFTNYDSRKARELAAQPRAAMVFWWEQLARQVRIEGRVTRVSAEESDDYFVTRPRESNLGAMVSRQSRVIGGREELEEELARTRAEWDGRELTRPPTWGGYRLMPRTLELWQGRPDRLHDRLRYDLGEELIWRIERLSP